MVYSSIVSAQTFLSMSYDYLIAGGGAAGLVLANRLTEDPNIKVGVIEAGGNNVDDLKVLTPIGLGMLQDDPKYDWAYKSVPQPNLDGAIVKQARGKGLGGSSSINYMQYTFASKKDLDAWGTLGNEGWNYDALQPYYKKTENYMRPSQELAATGVASYINEAVHGFGGPIDGAFPNFLTDVQKAWVPTFQGLGIGYNGDPRDGVSLGGYSNIMTINGDTQTRSHAGNGYYKPVSDRPNLKVVINALVNNIVFDPDTSGGVNATGLNFTVAGQNYVANATREVIVCGGVINSPQILELSGIGQKELLQKYGIKSVVDLPGVGENLQDHPQAELWVQVRPGELTLDDILYNETNYAAALKQYNQNRTGPISDGGTASNAPLSWSQILPSSQSGRPQQLANQYIPGSYEQNTPGLADQFALIKQFITDPNEAVYQEGGWPATQKQPPPNDPRRYIQRGTFLTHPLSRGNSHITSADPTVYPAFDPKYLSHPLDVEIFKDGMLHIQVVNKAPPLASFLEGNGTVYGQGIPSPYDESNVLDVIKKLFVTGWHPIATNSMMPKAKGGVVNSRLKVYGTLNLRVIDASVAPLHVRGNTVSMTYAIAEYGADIVKADQGKPVTVAT